MVICFHLGDQWTVTDNAEFRCHDGIASYVTAQSTTLKGIYFVYIDNMLLSLE